MHWSLSLALVLLLANGAYSESHIVSFVNNCGFGTPVLLVDEVVVSNGSDYSSDMSITKGVAYLDQDDCASGDSESCMEIEINLSNSSPSFVDIVLIPPQVYRSAACVTYSDGCDGASLACTEPGCSEAIVSEDDPSGSGAVLVCEESNANVIITFCDCAASPIGPNDPGVVTTSWTTDLASITTQNTTSWSSTSTPRPSIFRATASLVTSQTTTSQITTPTLSRATASSTSFTTSTARTQSATFTGSSSSTAHAMSASPSSFSQQSSSTASTATWTSGTPTSTTVGLATQKAVSRSPNVAAIVGGVLGAILILVLIIAAVFYVRHRRRVNATRMQSDPRGLGPSPGGHSRRSHSVYGDKGPGQTTVYAPISRASSPIVHSPRPRPASYETVLDIKSSSPDHSARITESTSSRVSAISSDNPFLLPPLASISSFSLLVPPGRGSPVGSQADHRASTFDPFADAHSVDDPPPSYMA